MYINMIKCLVGGVWCIGDIIKWPDMQTNQSKFLELVISRMYCQFSNIYIISQSKNNIYLYM